ncbi:hypothetical protein JCM8547_001638 [Rhodosporidiobolus lusitaniae]
MNSTLGLREVAKMEKQRQPWTTFYPPNTTTALVQALENPALIIRRTHQQRRLLESEGDVGDLVFYNILAPVVDILNELIAPQYRHYFSIEIQHQMSTTSKIKGYSAAEGKVVTRNVTMRNISALSTSSGFSFAITKTQSPFTSLTQEMSMAMRLVWQLTRATTLEAGSTTSTLPLSLTTPSTSVFDTPVVALGWTL